MTEPQTDPSRAPHWTLTAFRMGAMAVLPLLPGLAAFAMAYGTVAARRGFSLVDALLMTGTVYAGLTQLIVLETWPEQLTSTAIIGMVAVAALVNMRYLLISATLQPLLANSAPSKVYPTLFFLGEPNWLLSLRYHADGGRDPAFLLGSGVMMWFVWVLAAIPGYWLGASVGDPHRFGLDLVMPAFFVAMLVSLWRGPRKAVGWVAGGAAAIAADQLLGGFWYLIAGSIAGCLAGAFIDD